MTVLPYRDRSYVRFISGRTRETMFEITMLDGSMIVWGTHYRPDDFCARLADDRATVLVLGTLRDRVGSVVTFGECLDAVAGFRIEVGVLPEDFDASWSRDRT